MQTQQQIGVKVKTMDDTLLEFRVSPDLKVSRLKELIEQETEIPVARQRIIFMGKLLQDKMTLEEHQIQDNNVVHLIASLAKDRLPGAENTEIQETSVQEEDEQEREEEAPEISEYQERDILTGIFRTLNHNSTSRRNQRRRIMQQRVSGFNVAEKESIEVLRQNLETMRMLKAGFSQETTNANTRPKAFDFSNRKLRIGQWVDVKDTIDQWLEAEVIDVRNDQVYVHYNGWGARWDEWIDMNSPRISTFRSYTVNNPYDLFQSPNPHFPLDGNRDKIPESKLTQREILGEAVKEATEFTALISSLLQTLNRQKELSQQLTDLKSEKSPLSMKTKRRMNPLNIKKKKNVKSVYTQQDKPTKKKMDKEVDNIDTQSNLSLKISEKDNLNFRDNREDCMSMRSLKMSKEVAGKKNEEINKIDHGDSISSKSFKSQVSSNLNINFDQISEESSYDQEEEDKYNVEEEKIEIKTFTMLEEKKGIEREIVVQTQRIAPLMDRLGRMFTDLAPHVAMLGAKYITPLTINHSNISMLTHEGSILSSRIGDPLPRFTDPSHNNIFTSANRTAGQVTIAPVNELSSQGRALHFEVPVMLNGGELLSVSPQRNQYQLLGEGQVHLHLNAQVHLPSDGFEGRQKKQTSSKFAQTQELEEGQDSKRRLSWGNALSERPQNSEKKKGSDLWKWEAGGDSIKEMDLEDSFCGSIEERDEQEEPEMQDISFKEERTNTATNLPSAEGTGRRRTSNTLPEDVLTPTKTLN